MTDTVPVDDPWVYITDSGEDIKFFISEGQTMSSEIKVGVGTTFTYLGIDCIVISKSRQFVDEELYEFIYQYVNVVGEIVSGKMNQYLMMKLIEQGKIVIKG